MQQIETDLHSLLIIPSSFMTVCKEEDENFPKKNLLLLCGDDVKYCMFVQMNQTLCAFTKRFLASKGLTALEQRITRRTRPTAVSRCIH